MSDNEELCNAIMKSTWYVGPKKCILRVHDPEEEWHMSDDGCYWAQEACVT